MIAVFDLEILRHMNTPDLFVYEEITQYCGLSVYLPNSIEDIYES